jgi:hypothetical protein
VIEVPILSVKIHKLDAGAGSQNVICRGSTRIAAMMEPVIRLVSGELVFDLARLEIHPDNSAVRPSI